MSEQEQIGRACELLVGFAVVLSCPGVKVMLEFDEDELGAEVVEHLVDKFPEALKSCLRDAHAFVRDNRPEMLEECGPGGYPSLTRVSQ